MTPAPLAVAAILTTGLSAAAQPASERSRPLMRDFMGINAHTVQFDPELYAPLCRLVRDYHPYAWDVDEDSSLPPTFPLTRKEIGWEDTSGRFRSHQGRVDWQALYSAWQDHGFEIDACVQFDGFTPDRWKDPAEDAYRYGRAFAAYFGPSGPHKLVTSVEIGNEPAGKDRFSPEEYQTLFQHMARGIRDGDPRLTVLTATAEAEPDDWSMPLSIFADTPELYDVINTHKYASLEGWPTWERTFPEDPQLRQWDSLEKTLAWRDEHAPEKQVWLTEFGYDASTREPEPNGNLAQWRDVSDKQQAQWITRSFLTFAAMGFDRAYLYWFNDNDTPSMHASSGVTRHMTPKPSYWAMRHLYQSLGDYRLSRVVREDDGELFVHEYAHGEDPSQVVWVVWSPTGADREAGVTLDLPGELTRAERMPLSEEEEPRLSLQQQEDGGVELTATESPAYLWIRK